MRLALPAALLALVLSGCMRSVFVRRPAEPSVLVARVFVEADYDDVWDRLTRAELYGDWHSSPCLEFGDEPGERTAWGTPECVVYDGELVRIEKGRGLAHTFRFVGFGFDEPPTLVELDVVEYGPTVLVEVRHDCTGAPETYALIRPVGWPKSLSRLKTLLETGRAMPWPTETAD